jgi:hypothetical protein
VERVHGKRRRQPHAGGSGGPNRRVASIPASFVISAHKARAPRSLAPGPGTPTRERKRCLSLTLCARVPLRGYNAAYTFGPGGTEGPAGLEGR